MFKSRIEVDRHVENCLKKINSEFERNLRCFAFAKLYFKVGDYEQAYRYTSNYLNAKPLSAEGQHFLGKVLEKLGKRDSALEAYRSSLDLDPKQNNLILKVCELLAADDANLDQSGARYFCEKAQSFDPYNPIVFHLKERLVAAKSKDPSEVTTLLVKELETRPLDVDIRVRLLRHLLQNNQLKEAYTHVYDIEQKHLSIFLNNLSWYEIVSEVLYCYQREKAPTDSLTWEFWMLFISVLDKLVTLSLDERSVTIKNNTECVTAVYNFDQNLKVATENLKGCPEKQLVQEFINHFTAQLCFHLLTLLFKQAKKDLIKYKEAGQIALPLLFACYNYQPADIQSVWLQHTTDTFRQQVQRWNREGAYRCSQIGHVLLAFAKDRKTATIERATQNSTGLWRDQFFKKLFVTRDQQSKIKSSFFVQCPQLVGINIRLPESTDLLKFDNTALLVHPESLHHFVWIGLNHDLTTFGTSVFPGLQYSVKNLNNCAAETLNVLDILSFTFCSILCAQSQIDENKHTVYYNADKPNTLPASVVETLCTSNQTKWFQYAYKMYQNENGVNLGDVRLTLIRGIECIRCVGNHGLDVKLLTSLAKIFSARASASGKQSEIEFNDARAEIYWKTALPLLEKLKKQQALSFPTNRLFEHKIKEMNLTDVARNIDEGKLFLAIQLMKKKDHEKALAMFEYLRDPYASFYQAQIYKTMADKETNQNKENVTSEMRSQNIILLTKARDCFYLTLDRLRDPGIDRKHPLNEKLGSEIEKIERLLSRIDPDTCVNRNECDGMSDENVSSIESENYNTSNYHTSYANGNFTTRHEHHNIHSTPYRLDHSRREARPSPERLDAQLRQLVASKDTTMNNILEQNKIMAESHKHHVEELKHFKEAVCDLKTIVHELKVVKHSVEDIRDIKKSVHELKAVVDELQNFRSVTDMVYEMRKELQELKKDTTKIKSNQLSDEDLYVLDEEYGAEYNNAASNTASALVSNIYPNLGRLPAPSGNSMAYPVPPYHGMYPMYPYPGMGLPPAPSIPYGSDAQAMNDYRTLSSLSHGLNAPSITQSVYQQQPPTIPPAVIPPNNLHQSPFHQSPLSHLQQQTVSNFFKDNASPATPPTIISSNSATYQVTSTTTKALPLNVVITASDPLPSSKSTTVTPQILSVTIPPQHLKGGIKAHNYQITVPVASTTVATTPTVLSQPPAMPISTQGLLSHIAPPLYSAIADKSPNKGLGLHIERSIFQSFNKSDNDILNRSSTSTGSYDEHDPCPDFKPIVPLPDEVPVNTGEENEEIIFCQRAKLFRYVNKEWKERGMGELKILKNPDAKKTRILMRRDQVHKICANHFLTPDMHLKQMNKNEKAYIWAANDYADGEVLLETFCVQFKTPEIAKNFAMEFDKAKQPLEDNHSTKPAETQKVDTKKAVAVELKKPEAVSDFGGFKFISTPTFKPKDSTQTPEHKVATVTDSKVSPFASFTFKATEPAKEIAKPTFTFASNKDTAKPGSPFNILSLPSGNQTLKTNLFGSFATASPSTPDPVVSTTNVLKLNDSTIVKPSPITTASPVNLFSPVQKISESEAALNASAEEFVPTAEFKPVIPLPDLVDVKTGEENAEVLFEAKAKLLRFDSATKGWKEKGIGQMKVLKDNIIRLLMRREQVHKVCCNHQLLKNIEFTRMKTSATAITWCAKDFSEGILNTELFAIRFKTEEVALSFLDTLKKAQNMLNDNNAVTQPQGGDKKKKSIEVTPPTNKPGWGDKFKAKSGSWECKNCYIVNELKVNHCVACETPKNDTVPQKQPDSQFCFGVPVVESVAQPTTQGGFGNVFKPIEGSWECTQCLIRNDGDKVKCAACEFSKDKPNEKNEKSTLKGIDLSTGDAKFIFGIPRVVATSTVTSNVEVSSTTTAGFGDAFKPKMGSWECKECYTRNESDYCLACDCPKDDTIPVKGTKNEGVDLDTGGLKFNFGIPAATNSTASSTFTFQTSSTPTPIKKPFTFSLTTTTPKSDNAQEVVFGSSHKSGFEFTPRSPRRQSGGQTHEEESENSYYEEEEDTIYFKPVIPLPDKVEVTTGEEAEEVLYSHRAKLYRHVESEWKERGIGELKILFKREDNKLRVLMRREQIHKICLNHALTIDVKYTPKDEKTWLFCAADFSEGEIEYNNFCLRFKSSEIAVEFKKAIDDALKNISIGAEVVVGKDSDSDVEFVSETQVSAEEIEEAKRLQLPAKFMAYRQLPDCECQQCKKDDLIKTELGSVSTIGNSTAFLSFTSQDGTISNTSSVFGTPTNDTTSFSMASNSEGKHETLKELLIKPSLLASSGAAKPFLFSTTTSKPSIFGQSNFGTPTTTSNFFGAASFSTNSGNKSLFENPSSATPPANIFGGKPSLSTPPNIFGNAAISNTTSVFGSVSTSGTGNLFGTNTKSSEVSITPITNIFGTPATSTANIFGGKSSTPQSSFSFGGANSDNKTEKLILNTTSDLSFSSIAAKSEASGFGTGNQNDNPFANLGAGKPVFGSASPTTKQVPEDPNNESTEDVEAEHYDPHYEPIVPLPDAIVVTTGEEEETVLFSERGKLYRFTNKEWKERGVGDIKVLHHPKNNTYRLLLRRELVHKIVLNLLITSEFELKPFTMSSNTWMWVGLNFCENEHSLENLAARFKYETTSNKFYEVVQRAMEEVKKNENLTIPTTVETISDAEAEDEEQYEEDDEDDEADRTILFGKECTLSELSYSGNWQAVSENCRAEIFFDSELYGSRITVVDDTGCLVSNTIIGKNTVMTRQPDDDGVECQWQGVECANDYYNWKTLKMTFANGEDAQECILAYLESVNYAEQSGIIDEIPLSGNDSED